MTPLATIIEDLERADAFFAQLMYWEGVKNRYGSCNKDCDPNVSDCLYFIIDSLRFRVEKELEDEITEKLYYEMLLIIGSFTSVTAPSVNAGANQNVAVGSPATFTATITPGSGTITSILWTKVSGGSIVLSGTTTNTLVATDFAAGVFTFRVTVTDSNNKVATDTVSLTAVAVQVEIKYGFFDTEPDLYTAVLNSSMMVDQGSTEFSIPFSVEASNKYIVYSQPSTEPDKTNWFNTVLNYGTIPDSAMKAKIIVGGRTVTGSRDPFIFDSSTYTLKFST